MQSICSLAKEAPHLTKASFEIILQEARLDTIFIELVLHSSESGIHLIHLLRVGNLARWRSVYLFCFGLGARLN